MCSEVFEACSSLALQAVTRVLKTDNVRTVNSGRCTSVRVLLHQVQRQAAEAESVSGFADVRSPTVVVDCNPRRGCRCNTAEACSCTTWLVVHCKAVLHHCSLPAVHHMGVELLLVNRRGSRRRRGTSSTSEAVSKGVARPRSSPRSRGALKVRRGKTHHTGGRGRDTYATGTAVVIVGCGRCERCDLAGWCGGVCVSKSKARGREEVKEVKAVQRERQARDKHSWREEADLPIVTKLWTGRCEWAVE
jgi:hypothetical protein